MNESLQTALVSLPIGFLLTTVAGGAIGSHLQRRLWRHQWLAQRSKERLDGARALFEEVSRLMDRRLFRTSQMRTWLTRDDPERRAVAIAEYRIVLTEWNDSINRNLSLLHFYFGEQTRRQFDFGIGARFVKTGTCIDRLRALAGTGAKVSADIEAIHAEIDAEMRAARSEVYSYNLALLRAIEEMDRPAVQGWTGFRLPFIDRRPSRSTHGQEALSYKAPDEIRT